MRPKANRAAVVRGVPTVRRVWIPGTAPFISTFSGTVRTSECPRTHFTIATSSSMSRLPVLTAAGALFLAAGCAARPAATATTSPSPAADPHAGHMADTAAARAMVTITRASTVAPGASTAQERLDKSPRHGEWVTISTGPQPGDSLRAWVVYPQRSTRAPVVIVIQEIFGVTSWIRSVTDQLAAEGFIAIAPDFLTGKLAADASDSLKQADGPAYTRTLDAGVVQRQIDAVARYGMALPAAEPRYGVVGFCWGGAASFAHAVHSPTVGAAVVYYGTSPAPDRLIQVRAPVLGLYGENDARVNATVPAADSAMKALGRSFTPVTFPGAGHGFLRAQEGQNGANLAASMRAWPMTVEFFRTHLER